jgi:type I site-specific restriction endonuclease
MANINPEQSARGNIDEQLVACGWIVQDYKAINRGAGLGVAVRENPTNDGSTDYLLYVNGEAVGVIEAKRVYQKDSPYNINLKMDYLLSEEPKVGIAEFSIPAFF